MLVQQPSILLLDMEISRLFIENGANINAMTSTNETPCDIAKKSIINKEVLKLLCPSNTEKEPAKEL